MCEFLFAILDAANARRGLPILQRSLEKAQAAYDRAAATAERRANSPNPAVRARAQEAATAALDTLDEWRGKVEEAHTQSAALDAKEKELAATAKERLAQELREEESPALQQHRNCHAGL
jgi:hypothetical protein